MICDICEPKHSAQTDPISGFSPGKALSTRRKTESKKHIFTKTTHCLVSTEIGGGWNGAHFQHETLRPWAFYTGQDLIQTHHVPRGLFVMHWFFWKFVFYRGSQQSFIRVWSAPRSKSLTLLYAMYDRKGNLFLYIHLTDGIYSFHIPSLELSSLLTAVNALSIKYE